MPSLSNNPAVLLTYALFVAALGLLIASGCFIFYLRPWDAGRRMRYYSPRVIKILDGVVVALNFNTTLLQKPTRRQQQLNFYQPTRRRQQQPYDKAIDIETTRR